jgi:hypothetical protein
MGVSRRRLSNRRRFQASRSNDVISSSANAPRHVKRTELRKQDWKTFPSDDE